MRCLALRQRTLKGENLGKPSPWGIITDPWYTSGGAKRFAPALKRPCLSVGNIEDISSSHWLPEEFVENCPIRGIAQNECLFHRGEAAFAIFEVIKGKLRLVRNTVEGRQVVMNLSTVGDLFAEAALFANEYHCDAIAVEKTSVRFLDKSKLLALFRNDPELAEKFLSVMARQVQRLRAKLELRNIRSAGERLMQYLLLSTESDGRTVPIPGTVKELAKELGLTHVGLYRTLAKFEKDGLVVRTPSALVLRAGTII